MNSQTKTTSMTPHSSDIQHLHDVLEQQKYAYQRHPLATAKARLPASFLSIGKRAD